MEADCFWRAQGDALLAAISAPLGTKIDGVASQVAAVATRVEVDERQVVATNRTVETQGAQLSALDLRLSILEKGKAAPPQQGGDSGFCGGPDPWQLYGRRVSINAAAGSAASSGGGRPESVNSVSAFSATGE